MRRSDSAVGADAADTADLRLRVKVFDWQGAMESPPAVDVMYYVIGSLSTEVLQEHEEELILGCVLLFERPLCGIRGCFWRAPA